MQKSFEGEDRSVNLISSDPRLKKTVFFETTLDKEPYNLNKEPWKIETGRRREELESFQNSEICN